MTKFYVAFTHFQTYKNLSYQGYGSIIFFVDDQNPTEAELVGMRRAYAAQISQETKVDFEESDVCILAMNPLQS